MNKYELSINVSAYGLIDEFALLACQDYNLGNESKWFNAFRGGLNGFRARINGFISHYNSIHAWIPTLREPSEIEHHLASIFFCMDSAVECLAFALNALGFATSPDQFRDITSDHALRRISQKDILGEYPTPSAQLPLLGYKNICPQMQRYWQSRRDLLLLIIEQHDVSKHRETIFTGGRMRNDPPPRFYDLLGINDNDEMKVLYAPIAEIILKNNPKVAHAHREPQEVKDFIFLEDVAVESVQFVVDSGKLSGQDVKSTIILKHTNFLQKN